MPKYAYRALDTEGANNTGSIDASNENLAFQTLTSRGLTVIELKEGDCLATTKPWYLRDIEFARNELRASEKADAARLIATLFSAELTAPDVIRIASTSTEIKGLRFELSRTLARMQEGEPMAVAFAQEARSLGPLFPAFIAAADRTNTAAQLLKTLADFLERQAKARQGITAAMVYPSILVVAGTAVILLLSMFLAPNLAPVFSSMNLDPPVTLNFLLALNSFLLNWGRLVMFLAVPLVVFLIAFLMSGLGQAWVRRFSLQLPIIGPALQITAIAQSTEALMLLLNAGEPLPTAFRNAGKFMAPGTQIQSAFDNAADNLEMGGRAATALEASDIANKGLVELVRVGEETNRLPETLAAASRSLWEQSTRQQQRVLALLTPALTLFFGLGIGFLVYSMMGAMLQINDIAF